MTMQSCIFCKIVRREVSTQLVFEDDLVVAFHDLQPQAPTHLLVIPRQHIASFEELGPEHVGTEAALLRAAQHVARAHHLSEPGYRLVINMGRDGGQSVSHLHLHVLGGRAMTWPPG